MTDSEERVNPEILSEFIEKVSRIFDRDSVEDAARETGFVQRESVLTGHLFLTVFVFGMSIYGTPTLEQLIGLLKTAVPGIGITRPGFHQRINEYAVEFFEFMLSKAIRIAVPSDYDLNLLKNFDRIIIMDSTSFQLPENLAGIFAGSGGSASGSAVKIQFGFDLKSSSFFYVIQDGNLPDNCEQNAFSELTGAGDLIIRDMGYFVIKNFKDIDDKKAYYLSRFRTDVNIYIKDKSDNFIKKDICEILKTAQNTPTEQEIRLKTGESFIKTRLIVEKVPDAVYSQRIRNINKRYKKKGQTASERVKLCASANLYISNTSEELLPKKHFRAVYAVRWQIELVFKSWKSSFALDRVTGYREERIKCMIYAKLLFIFITSAITHAIKNYVWLTQNREVSEFRAAGIFRISASEWLRLLICEPGRVKIFLEELAGFISLQCLKIRQKDRIYPLELLEGLS